MTKIKYILLFLALALYGCEQVIDVDLNEADPEIVIEANLSNTTNLGEVLITKTGSYFGDTPIEKISDAAVSIEDEFGNLFNLEEVEEGYYTSDQIGIEDDVTYKLKIDVAGSQYESTSKLNPVVPMDSLTFFYDDGFAYFEGGYSVKMFFIDPPDQDNYYRVKIYENDTLVNEVDEIILFDDFLIDGQELEISLQGYIFEPEDTISVQLMSLDEGAYEYFKTLQELQYSGSAAPANPTSNISNGALGFFSTWSSDTKSVVIKELEQ